MESLRILVRQIISKKKIKWILIVISLSFISAGCYPGITGKVIDAETGQPIEGAVVLVEWTRTKGIGLRHTESYKVVEVVSDKNGNITIGGVLNPLVNPPRITVYKKGYVAWNNEYIFPDYKKRRDFAWTNNYTFNLAKFKPEYSYNDHVSFISSAISSGFGGKKLIYDAIDWEEKKAFEERKKTWKTH